MKIKTTFFILCHFFLNLSAEPFATLEEEYTPNYCLQLEAAYGDGMMSEGGAPAIDWMFDQIVLEGKSALDIGCGLGGVAFYLAESYGMQITGLEVNPWMVQEATRRIPESLKGKVGFLLSTSNSNWKVASESCDLIYSKGVLTHLETKDEVFQESHRILKSEGLLIITDWLSGNEKKWGEHVARLVELENLALFPESVAGYIEALEKNGFTVLSVRDDSAVYEKFNQEIIESLKRPARREMLLNYFSDDEKESAIEGYVSIAEALKVGELKTIRFIAQKN